MSATVRCKYLCQAVKKSVPWNDTSRFIFSAEFAAVSDGSPENKAFYEATPGGSLTIATYKQDLFTPGKAYYLDVSEAG